jgi:hypothetical protein
MPKFRELLLQLRERSLWQILGSYVVASWVALQVLDTVSALLGLPLWFTRPVLILLIIGFFVLLLTGVVQRTWTNLEARADSRPERTRLGRLLTWRKALAGVTAFALLGVFTAVWLAMRTLGIGPVGSLIARGVLDEPATVAEALARMEREPGEDLPADVALQLAEREGIPVVVAGQIIPAGSGYVLSARLVAPGSGAILASRRETAADEARVIRAIDRLSKGLRERIGESLRSIQGDPPLSRVTTANLEALKKFSEASRYARVGEAARAIGLLEEAVAIDTSFAAAWRGLAVYLAYLINCGTSGGG